jgi:MFS family permease
MSVSKSPSTSVVSQLFPIMAAVFVAFLMIGIALPVLPVHVHHTLGFGTFVVGLVAGAQSAAALISRFWSGNFSDSKGGKIAVIAGLFIAAVSGCLYLLSCYFRHLPNTSVAILILGRGVLGGAESFIITGSLIWGLSLGGTENSGRVISWLGTALYVALAVGAPAGTALYASFGFIAIALVTLVTPLITMLLVLPRQFERPAFVSRPRIAPIVKAVWKPGFGMAMSSLGFGAVTTFIVLLFTFRHWPLGWLAVTSFALSFITCRLFFAHLADHIGGARAAMIFAIIEAAGLLLVFLADSSWLALAGAVVTGFGYSLVYPGFGVEALRRTPPENKGLAMGAFTAFLDLALGIANPALGLLAGEFGLKSVFLVSAVIVGGSAFMAWRMVNARV